MAGRKKKELKTEEPFQLKKFKVILKFTMSGVDVEGHAYSGPAVEYVLGDDYMMRDDLTIRREGVDVFSAPEGAWLSVKAEPLDNQRGTREQREVVYLEGELDFPEEEE